MDVKYFVIDAFTDELFGGNPAGVCLPEAPLDDITMQRVAAENNLSETAFVLPSDDGCALRWFTPTVEIALCGHATLASAFVLRNFTMQHQSEFLFHTKSGLLTVRALENGLYEMDFPARQALPIEITEEMAKALGCDILEAHASPRDLLLLLDSEAQVRSLAPDMERLRALHWHGVIATAQGDAIDFVSRFFAPNMGIPEDPVTGSSHCTLIPFWAARLGKSSLSARQVSARGGALLCEHCGERVKIAGRAALYLEGTLHV